MQITRRQAVTSTAASATLAALTVPSAVAAPKPKNGGGALREDPFTLGVASGEPLPTGVVLWTRLALDPLADDGLGGMPTRTVPVQWQVARDEGMTRIVARGTALARPESGYAVHVECDTLMPGREYFYRFKTGRHVSPTGRTRTAPAHHETPAALAMAFASCSQYEHGYFTAYRHMAEEHPDLVLHLGDYQYEYAAGEYIAPTGNVRDHIGGETVTLGGYRQRYAQYKLDEDLQAAHAIAPWLVIWDDHEVDNNWAADVPEDRDAPEWNDTRDRFLRRRANAMQAYYENMPLRRSNLPKGADMQLYRTNRWGKLANLHMLDTRQYRDDQPCGDGLKPECEERAIPTRTLTGDRQEQWLSGQFRASQARWDVLGQQIFFAQWDLDPTAGQLLNMDGWDGYTASRDRVTKAWMDAGVRNPLVLTGDVHTHWANDLKADYTDPDSAVVGAELVCSSITSNGDQAQPWVEAVANGIGNEHIQYGSGSRGYVSTRFTAGEMVADFRAVESVTVPNAPVRTEARFRLTDGQRGLERMV